MKDLKKRVVVAAMVVVCSLLSLGITLGSEVITPVPVCDESVEVKNTDKKKEKNGDRYYFYYLQADEKGKSFFISDVIKAEKDETPDMVFERVLKCNEKSYTRSVVIIEFHRLE